MSANLDTMMYVGEVPWHGLGVKYDTPPQTAKEVVEAAGLDWDVAAAKMTTAEVGDVPGYHAIYRTDNGQILGVVNRKYPDIVQNIDTFNTVDKLLGTELQVETAAGLGRGETVFGCFKISEQYKVLDDAVDHYFVIMNDHLRVDGKVTVLNTPIRVVCQNTLSAALNQNYYKLRIPISADMGVNSEIAAKLLESAGNAIMGLSAKAEKMATMKVTREDVEKIMDELFPLPQDASEFSKAAEKVQLARDTFITQCMNADNLGNYRGTHYQIFNALTDFSSHYFTNADKMYDLNYRMKLLPGMSSEGPGTLVTKYMKMLKDVA